MTELTRKDLSTSGLVEVAIFVGRWSITFGDSRFIVEKDELIVVNGEYTATADRISLSKETGHYACTSEKWETVPKGFSPGTYNWAFHGKLLTLAKVSDECAPRVRILTSHPWAKRY